MMKKGDLEYGDIVWTQFTPSIGHEYKNKRPAVVIESNAQMVCTNLVTIIPLTSNIDKAMTDDIKIVADDLNKLMMNSVAKVYGITSFDYSRFDKKIGKINGAVSDLIKAYLKKHFDIS